MNPENDPMDRGPSDPREPDAAAGEGFPFDLATLPRCGARTRSGTPCRRYGTKRNGRCRLHGGRSTGAPGNSNALTFGLHTREAKAERRALRAFLNRIKSSLA